MKNLKSFGVVLLSTVLLASCSGGEKEKPVASIAITTNPTKLTYISGEKLDLTGMVVTATYEDGSSKEVTGYTTDITVDDLLSITDEKVTVTYKEKTAEFDIDVNIKYDLANNIEQGRQELGSTALSIYPMTGVTIDNVEHTVTFQPELEDTEYTISGYFKGMLINKVKNTVLTLNEAFIENDGGKSVIFGDGVKTNISTVAGTKNYLVQTGLDTSETYVALYQAKKKNVEMGGSGTCYLYSEKQQVLKCDECEIKGSGTYYIQGNRDESVISCNLFEVAAEKTVSVYISRGKNGIKADEGMSIQGGTFYMGDNKTAFKTEVSEDPALPYTLALNTKVYNHMNDVLTSTGEGCLTLGESYQLIED